MRIVQGKKGKVVLYNPAEKGRKYATELKHKQRHSGLTGEFKEELTPTQLAFRAGYLKARSDGAKAYKAKLAKQNTTTLF